MRIHLLINVFYGKIYESLLKPVIENVSSTYISILIPDFDYYLNVNWKELNNRILKPELKVDNNYNDYIIENIDDNNSNNKLPIRIIGDIQKKGDFFGLFNRRYLELNLKYNTLIRYESIEKYYNKIPLETISIKSITKIKRLKTQNEYFPFEITIEINGKKKTHTYRVKHKNSRDKWLEYLTLIYEYFNNNSEINEIDNKKLIFIDDHIGTIQEVNGEKNYEKEKISLNNFQILEILGAGGFGSVYKVKEILTGKLYAMKVINKNSIIQKRYFHYIMSEYEILKFLSGCPFILDIYYCFQSANYLYMIIDLCSNGDLTNLKYVNNKKLICAELILAFEYIHKHNIIYRDLKPENILLDNEGHIKICDFNLAKKNISKNKRAYSFCGSPIYLSPEMLSKNGVNYKADIYQIGLIIYQLYTGIIPFESNNLKIIYDNIKNNKIDFEIEIIKSDYNLYDLLKKILVVDEEKRLNIDQIKRHPFFYEINWNKVYNKKSGFIKIEKDNENITIPIVTEKKVIKGKNLREIEQLLEKEIFFTPLNGKISLKEMKKDQKRPMKNYVKKFYYIKPDLLKNIKEFQVYHSGEKINIIDNN